MDSFGEPRTCEVARVCAYMPAQRGFCYCLLTPAQVGGLDVIGYDWMFFEETEVAGIFRSSKAKVAVGKALSLKLIVF